MVNHSSKTLSSDIGSRREALRDNEDILHFVPFVEPQDDVGVIGTSDSKWALVRKLTNGVTPLCRLDPMATNVCSGQGSDSLVLSPVVDLARQQRIKACIHGAMTSRTHSEGQQSAEPWRVQTSSRPSSVSCQSRSSRTRQQCVDSAHSEANCRMA